jgi:hypothetical protein
LRSISKNVIVLNQPGKLLRKPSGGEQAESKLYWQVPESELRTKLIFLAGEDQRADAAS